MHYLRIGLIGDYSPDVAAHEGIEKSLALIADATEANIEPVWLPTLNLMAKPISSLEALDALWCVPGSPYASMAGALRAIRYARERGVPFLGTCGGFQHAVLEYARNVLRIDEADHAESNPGTAAPVISALTCELVEKEGVVRFAPESRLRQIYEASEARELYRCRFGLNPAYRRHFDNGAIRLTGFDEAGEARALELSSHPFFVATLFQPERAGLHGIVHPLVNAFVKAAFREAGIAANA